MNYDRNQSHEGEEVGKAGGRLGRAGRKRSPERGLPSEEALRQLARTYLERQRALWPALAASGELPEPAEDSLAELASGFRGRFLSPGRGAGAGGRAERGGYLGPLAASYVRYSDESSNPRSLDQQLGLQLKRAAEEGHFIPWELVFADAAVTGTSADRRGYRMAKEALVLPGLRVLYIDEVARASRNSLEALNLGQEVDRAGKRLVGVSDGFDSASPQSKMILMIHAMLSEGFVDQLKSKVRRGMDDAFARGTNIHAPAVGYRLEPATDAAGRPVYGKDRDQVNAKVIDPAEAEEVRGAFTDFLERGKSPRAIALGFNDRRVGGMDTWDDGRVRQLFRRETYMGIEVYRRTRQLRDPETGTVRIEARPRRQWKVRSMPHLRIISPFQWRQAQRKLRRGASAFAGLGPGGGPSRSALYPLRLIRPVCGSCGVELILGRSGQYASFCCVNGKDRKKGCTLRTYKAVRIVEGTVLAYLRREVFTPAFRSRVLESANRWLAERAARPIEPTAGLESDLSEARAARARLVRVLEVSGDAGLEGVVDRIRQLEERIGEVEARLRAARSRNATPPAPLTEADLAMLLEDLPALLEADVAEAAPILAELTGPIVVRQVQEVGKKKPDWVADFRINEAPVMALLARRRNHPTSGTWEYLNTAGWTAGEPVDLVLRTLSKPQELSTRAITMAANGTTVEAIARSLKTTAPTVVKALAVAGSVAPAFAAAGPSRIRGGADPKYVRLAPQVAQMRKEGRMRFTEIARALGVTNSTAARAYDHASGALAETERGGRAKRGRVPLIGLEKTQEVERRLERGEGPRSIAEAVGCGVSTIYRIKVRMRDDPCLFPHTDQVGHRFGMDPDRARVSRRPSGPASIAPLSQGRPKHPDPVTQ